MLKTRKGKSQSRLNALKHGLFATDDIFIQSLEPHHRKIFNSIREQIHTWYAPKTSEEIDLADRIAIQKFRIFRLYALENSAVIRSRKTLLKQESVLPHLDRLARYDSRITKQLNDLGSSLDSKIHFRHHRDTIRKDNERRAAEKQANSPKDIVSNAIKLLSQNK